MCDGDSVEFDAGFCNQCTFRWDNLLMGQMNIGNEQTFIAYDSGIYAVTVASPYDCPLGRDTVQLAVVTEATVSVEPPSLAICSGDTTDILLQCNLSGCTFSWSAVASSPLVSGYSSGTGDSIRQTLFNSDTIDQTVTYSIVPSISGCGADTTDYSVLIHPRPPVSVTITASINPVCQGIPVTFTAIPVNGGANPSNQWQVNGINTGTNNSIFTYYPTTGDQVSCILTSSESCTSGNPATSNPITMSVAEQPAVSFSICFDTITTLNAKPYKLKGGIPLGGTYTGTGVDQINGYFLPAMAGIGSKPIKYTYTNVYQCTNLFYPDHHRDKSSPIHLRKFDHRYP